MSLVFKLHFELLDSFVHVLKVHLRTRFLSAILRHQFVFFKFKPNR